MTTDTLDFPTLIPVAAPAAAPAKPQTAVATVNDAALAPLVVMEATLKALAERYRDVAFDLTTTKGLDAAKAARLELRESGRFAVQRARDKTKYELNTAKGTLEETATRLIAIVKPTEDSIHELIEKREAEIKAEKERKAAEAAARKADFEARIAQIRDNVQLAQGRTAAELAPVLPVLNDLIAAFDPAEWEEFADAALLAMQETLAALTDLHDRTKKAEDDAAALEAQRVEQAARQAELDRQAAEAARITAEANAKAALMKDRMDRILEIQAAATGHENATSANLAEAIRLVSLLDCTETPFGEFASMASMARDQTLTVLRRLHDAAVAADLEVERLLRTPLALDLPPEEPAAAVAPVAPILVDKPTADANARAFIDALPEALQAEPDDDTPLETTEAEARSYVAPPADLATITVGVINARLKHIAITADALRAMGFAKQARPGAGAHFLASDWPAICAAIVAHVNSLKGAF